MLCTSSCRYPSKEFSDLHHRSRSTLVWRASVQRHPDSLKRRSGCSGPRTHDRHQRRLRSSDTPCFPRPSTGVCSSKNSRSSKVSCTNLYHLDIGYISIFLSPSVGPLDVVRRRSCRSSTRPWEQVPQDRPPGSLRTSGTSTGAFRSTPLRTTCTTKIPNRSTAFLPDRACRRCRHQGLRYRSRKCNNYILN